MPYSRVQTFHFDVTEHMRDDAENLPKSRNAGAQLLRMLPPPNGYILIVRVEQGGS